MSDLKTQPHSASVSAFIVGVDGDQKRKDCRKLLTVFKKATGERPKMWGTSIVGYGSYHYKYASGREGDWMATGFSPRKQNLTVYIMIGFDRYKALLKKIGPHKTTKSCLYLKSLEGIDLDALGELIAKSVNDLAEVYPGR